MSEDHYAKLDQRIVYSSMWEEDGDTCKVWVTLLALKSLNTGVVDKNITGIARLCNLPLAKVEEAFKKFMSPDPRSSSPDHEGRRLIKVENGYLVVNHEKYTELGWSDEKREYERRRKAEQRARKAAQNGHTDPPPPKPPKTKPAPEDDDSDIIEAIYDAYPKKVGKPDALKAIARVLKEFEFDVVLERTKLYAAARAGQDSKFTPHPSTFFNQHRFNDDPSTWKDSPKDVVKLPEQNQLQEHISVPSLMPDGTKVYS